MERGAKPARIESLPRRATSSVTISPTTASLRSRQSRTRTRAFLAEATLAGDVKLRPSEQFVGAVVYMAARCLMKTRAGGSRGYQIARGIPALGWSAPEWSWATSSILTSCAADLQQS